MTKEGRMVQMGPSSEENANDDFVSHRVIFFWHP